MKPIDKLRLGLARVFDDNLHTRQWHNVVDYLIIGLILLSTFEVFLSTFDLPPQVVEWMYWIDHITLVIFTIEVILRIWVADLSDDKYRGFWGRVRYCFSFYGLIDILSTFPFYVQYLIPIPYSVFKVLRVARLLRIFRYMRSFRLLSKALRSKRQEMMVSLQFLVIVTVILSFILFFFEHAAQPEVYDNGFRSVVWAFAQYIGDPGGFAETPPITFVGRIIACIIGILGIAIFAVPAGLIGAGFTEAMGEENHNEEVQENIKKLARAFERKLDRPTGFQLVPPFISVCDVQARMGMKTDDIIDAVQSSINFRLINTAIMRTVDERAHDVLAIEHFVVNRSYGCCIDRGSKVTIFAPSNIVDPVMGHFAYYLAKIGGFNYISREVGETRPYRSYYKFADESVEKNLPDFMADMNALTARDGSWVITILAASGSNEPSYPTQIHFVAGGKKGDESLDAEGLQVKDRAAFKTFVAEATEVLKRECNLDCDFQRYHGGSVNLQNHFANKLKNAANINAISIYVAWAVSCWDPRRTLVGKLLAEAINHCIEPEVEKQPSVELKRKGIGFEDYVE